jgi:hypothetical protein
MGHKNGKDYRVNAYALDDEGEIDFSRMQLTGSYTRNDLQNGSS